MNDLPPPIRLTPVALRSAIKESRGNLTRAANALRVSRRSAMKYARRWGLNDFARDLRRKHGMPDIGRPPRIVKASGDR